MLEIYKTKCLQLTLSMINIPGDNKHCSMEK